jgi:hypothetical protein
MITPVEKGSIWLALQAINPASFLHVVRARSKPSLPVPAFALPVLISNARMGECKLALARCALATLTGAAQNRFWVNTPATTAPGSSTITTKSSWLAFLMWA